MNRRSILKLSPLLAGLFWPTQQTKSVATEVDLHFQQDPATDWHYADRVPGSAPAVAVNGVGFVVDMSGLDAGMKIVQGHVYIKDIGSGRGSWKVETRPTNLPAFPPNMGWQLVHTCYPSGVEIAFQLAARCGNDGKFELRITREQATSIEWAFAPIWWWADEVMS